MAIVISANNKNSNKAYETIYLKDPNIYPDAPSWTIPLDDKSITAMQKIAKRAIDKAEHLGKLELAAINEVEYDKVQEDMVKLQKRTIVAVVGEQGYRDVLLWMSPDENPIEHKDYIVQLGEVFAGFLVALEVLITSPELRKFSEKVQRQTKKSRPRKKR